VRYLLDKGANAEIVDNNGHKPIDLVGVSPAPGRGGTTPDGASPATAEPSASGAVSRGGPAGGNSTTRAANVAEIRELLRNSVSRK
jgi:hypothetical protein